MNNLNIKITTLPKLIYRFNTLSIKISADFFTIDNLKLLWKFKRPRIAKTILKKNLIDDGGTLVTIMLLI